MNKKKVLFVATMHSHIIHFHLPYLEYWNNKGYEVHVAANLDTKTYQSTMEQYPYVVWHDIDFARNPFSKQTIISYQQLKKIMIKYKFELMHTHTPIASIVSRYAANKAKIPKIVYTAHGFHFFNGGSKLNWLIYYPIEKIFSKYTDVLITINKEDYKLAKEKFHSQKTEYIPGVGVYVEKFAKITCDIKEKKQELGIKEHQTVLLSVGELNENKNHEMIIRALKKLDNTDLRYIIAGKGELHEYLQNLIEELKLTEKVQLLGYRRDINELCQMCDVFCFPSYREGLGLAAIEALSSGKPLITSATRGIDDYSVDGITGFKSKDYSVDGFAQAIQNYLDNRNNFDAELLKKQAERFSIGEVQKTIHRIYEEVI